MGEYVTRILSNDEIKEIVVNIRDGYVGKDGTPHRPNPQIATILLLQANLGCRICDIVNLSLENIDFDGDAWRLNLIEQKTGKPRPFIIPAPVKELIDNYCEIHNITSGRLFTVKEAAVWKQLRNVRDYLGLENVGTHSFRKSAGFRVYMDSGMDIALTTQFYNHSSPNVTMRYLNRSSKQMDEAISKSVCLL